MCLSKNIGKKKIINEQNDKEIITFPTNQISYVFFHQNVGVSAMTGEGIPQFFDLVQEGVVEYEKQVFEEGSLVKNLIPSQISDISN